MVLSSLALLETTLSSSGLSSPVSSLLLSTFRIRAIYPYPLTWRTPTSLHDSFRDRYATLLQTSLLVGAFVESCTSLVCALQHIFLRLSNFLHLSSRTNAVPRVQPRNPLDVPATLPLPYTLSGQAATQFDQFEMSSPPRPSSGPVTGFLRQHLSFLVPPVVEVAPGRKFT